MARACSGDSVQPPTLQWSANSKEHCPCMQSAREPGATRTKQAYAGVSALQCTAQKRDAIESVSAFDMRVSHRSTLRHCMRAKKGARTALAQRSGTLSRLYPCTGRCVLTAVNTSKPGALPASSLTFQVWRHKQRDATGSRIQTYTQRTAKTTCVNHLPHHLRLKLGR